MKAHKKIVEHMNKQPVGTVVHRAQLQEALGLSRRQMDRALERLRDAEGLPFEVLTTRDGKSFKTAFRKSGAVNLEENGAVKSGAVKSGAVNLEESGAVKSGAVNLEQPQPSLGDFLNMSEAEKANEDFRAEYNEAAEGKADRTPEAVFEHYRALGASLGLVGEPGNFRMPEPEKVVQKPQEKPQDLTRKPEALFRKPKVDTKTKAFEAALEYRSTAMSVWNVTRREAEDFAATCNYPPGAEYLSEKQRFAWAIDTLIGNKAMAARGH